MDNSKVKNNITEGSIVKTLITLSIPIVFANILQTAYQLTDTFWVGRLGANAVAAVSLSFPVIFLMIALGGGLGIAGSIMVAQYKGQKNQEKVDLVSAQTLITVTVVSIIITIVGYFISPPMMRLMGAAEGVFSDAVLYMQVTFIGIISMFGFMVISSLMRGVGDVKTPMYIVLATVILNLFLDPIFINGYAFIPAYGVTGAAIATVITQAISTIAGLYYLLHGKYGIHIQRKYLVPNYSVIKRMCYLGFPASVEQSTRALGLTVMTILVASFGTTIIAAYGIGIRVFSFVIIPAIGISMATSTIVGQNMGAGRIDRAEESAKISAVLSFVILTIVGVLFFIFAEPITAAFIPGDHAVIAESVSFIRIMALTFGFMGIQQSLNGTFQGSGNTFISMVIAIVAVWILQFPVAYILSNQVGLGVTGLWYAYPISLILSAIIAVVWFLRGSWKKSKVTEKHLEDDIYEEAVIEEGAIEG